MRAVLDVVRLGDQVWWRLTLAVLLGVGAALSAIGLTATSGWLISRAAQQPPVLYLLVAVTAVRAFGVSRGVLRYAERLAGHDAAFRILGRLRTHAYARLEQLAPAGLSEFRSGDLVTRLVADVDGLADLWLRVGLPYAVASVAGGMAVGVVWMLVPAAGLALAATLLFVAFCAPPIAAAVSRTADRGLAGMRGELAAEALDVLSGAQELVVAGAAPERLRHLDRLDGRLAVAEGRAALGAGVGTLMSLLAAGAAVWLCLLSGIAALRAGSLDGVFLAVVVLTPIAVHEMMVGVSPAAQHLPGLAAAADRVVAVLARPNPVTEPSEPWPLPVGPYGLSLRGLSARYPAGPIVLRGVDLDIAPGDRVLVTGASGSGKSTLAAVLLRFLEPDGGSVDLTGSNARIDLRRLAGEDVRRVVGLCAQDPHLFDTTLLENVRLARPDATTAEIVDALRRAGLLAWVESLPAGLDTLVGENGRRLSGGQRQRLSLARALLAAFPIVIFDEPTEHLDDETAEMLVAGMLETVADRTLIVMTHRPELMSAIAWTTRLDLDALGSEARRQEAATSPPASETGQLPNPSLPSDAGAPQRVVP